MDETWTENIQDYRDGKMNHQEKLRFEEEINGNTELAAVFRLYGTIEDEMRSDAQQNQEESELAATLKGLSKMHFGAGPQEYAAGSNYFLTPPVLKPKTPAIEVPAIPQRGGMQGFIKLNFLKKVAVAAVAIGLIGVGLFFVIQPDRQSRNITADPQRSANKENGAKSATASSGLTVSPPKPALPARDKEEPPTTGKSKPAPSQTIKSEQLAALFTRFALPDSLPPQNQRLPALEEGDAYYEGGHYGKAATAYKENIDRTKISTRGPQDGQKMYLFYAHYYKAQSHLRLGSTAEALRHLNTALQNKPDDFWQCKTQWYLALAYLQLNNLQKAEALLSQLANSDEAGNYRQKAKVLTKALSSLKTSGN